MSSQRSIPTVDRISALPDSIICHILSFLSTKQSAATSILSKRWNPLWLSVLNLDFDHHDFKDLQIFRLFVYSVMLTRDPTLPIQSFRLKCCISPGCDPHDINRFVRAAVQRGGVQNLSLDLLYGPFQNRLGPIVSTIFNSRNLVVLKLTKLLVNVLPQINFPLLKTLHLVLVVFQKQNDLKKLIEGCPILDELQLTYVLYKCLEIKDGEFKCLPNLVRANITNFNCLPNLLRDNSTSFQQLKNISFDWICNAKFLRLELSQEQQVHTFHNLTHMELIFASTWRTKWKWLLEVLQNCPKLQNLILHKLYGHGIDEDDWNEPQAIPKCISSQLRTCSLIDYRGMKCELQFAKYILENAKLLHTMTISASSRDLNIKHQMLMDLSLCTRGSATCKLSFI